MFHPTHAMAASPRWITPDRHPLNVLLGLEWVLLGFILLSCIPRLLDWQTIFPTVTAAPIVTAVNLFCLGLIGLMGLWLPGQNHRDRSFYLIGLYLLILIPSIWGRLPLFQLLYVIYIARSCLICSGRGRWVLTLVSIVTVVMIQVDRSRYWQLPKDPAVLHQLIMALQIGSIALLGLTLLFLQLFITAILSARRSERELAQAHGQLRTYALQIEDIAILQERNRIAREIHDALGHSLTAFNLHLEAALRQLDPNPAKAKDLLREAQSLGKATLQDVRRSISILRTDPLQERTLDEAMGELCEDQERSTSVRPSYRSQLNLPLSPAQTTVVYRISQEALTNIAKYAQAKRVDIQLIPQGDRIRLTIQDDGVGFLPDQTQMGFGLQGMRERVASLQGHLEIRTGPGQGCCLIVEFPR
ncbi:MAG: sensor histidine kinase [Alkalinema sp. RU_4_3]|nr:sensor histidine kinase [Alkalinema sp. RU_4_3]